mmetsp:Transcript_27190/g.63816  ORF Transcript_27190/g.63816 Transcript_27190/m.63816 type:complete len:271 (+) Transcript_27190:796-1608(+)
MLIWRELPKTIVVPCRHTPHRRVAQQKRCCKPEVPQKIWCQCQVVLDENRKFKAGHLETLRDGELEMCGDLCNRNLEACIIWLVPHTNLKLRGVLVNHGLHFPEGRWVIQRNRSSDQAKVRLCSQGVQAPGKTIWTVMCQDYDTSPAALQRWPHLRCRVPCASVRERCTEACLNHRRSFRHQAKRRRPRSCIRRSPPKGRLHSPQSAELRETKLPELAFELTAEGCVENDQNCHEGEYHAARQQQERLKSACANAFVTLSLTCHGVAANA